jgi:hypothetical protein
MKPESKNTKKKKRKTIQARLQWLTPVILDTWEAEIKRIKIRGQQIV